MEGEYGENSGIRYLSRMACKCQTSRRVLRDEADL